MRGRVLALLLASVLAGLALLPVTPAAALTTRPFVGSFGSFALPQSLAVDQSNGDIYVLDAKAQTVSRFDSSFEAKSFPALGTNVIDGKAAQLCTGSPSPDCDQVPFNGFSFPSEFDAQVAIDNSGNPATDGQIYVADPGHGLVDVFSPEGAYVGSLSQTGSAGAAFGQPSSVAVDSAGAVYIGDSIKNRIHKFVRTSAVPTNADFVADLTTVQPMQLAAGVGGTAGALFVTRRNGTVQKISTAGVQQYQVAAGKNHSVAVDTSTGRLMVVAATKVSEIDASGPAPLVVGTFAGAEISGGSGVAVDGGRDRVYVSEANGKVYVYGSQVPPTAPSVALAPYVSPSTFGAGLVGYVDQKGLASTYYFEYGPEDCAGSACTRLPSLAGVGVGAGIGPVRVSQQVTGLQPGTTYHYRLVASNQAGTTVGDDATFTTLESPSWTACPNSTRRDEQGTARLPGCRAYELVSAFPEERRNGLDVWLNSTRVRAATSGDAFQFTSLGGAGDVAGVPSTAEYMTARKPASGWSVHGITPAPPRASPSDILGGREPHYMGEFTADLSKAVFQSNVPLNAEGVNTREVVNLYRREDLLSPGAGVYRLLSDAATLQDPHPPGQTTGADQEVPIVAGSSSDLGKVVFESPRSLTADAAGLASGPRLYKWADDALALVGILPASEGGGPSISQVGRGVKQFGQHAVSADGSRAVFTAPPFDSAGTGGRLYLRDDQGTAGVADDTTVKVSASEKTNGAGPGGTDPGGAQPATFWDASADTSQVFFTSAEALTDDVPTGAPAVPKLYRYDLDAPLGQRLTLLSVDGNPDDGISNAAEGVVGVSADGSYVYFVGGNQLVPGLSTASQLRIFLWHDGTVQQVGGINSGAERNMILGIGGFAEEGKWSRVSADGRRLIFFSEGNGELVGYDHGTTCTTGPSPGCREIYLYSAADADGGGRLSCVSCRPDGRPAKGNAELNTRDTSNLLLFFINSDHYLNRAISADGRHVFFTTEDQISPYDENQVADVYDFDTATGVAVLLSGGRPGTPSFFLDASSDGGDVFFVTRSKLLGGDGNDLVDVYDARVGGGFAEPAPPPPPCQSIEACRPLSSGAAAPAADPESARSLPAAGQRRPKRKGAGKRKQRQRRHHHAQHQRQEARR